MRFLGYYEVSNIYALLGFALMIVVSFGINWSALISKSDTDNIFLVLFIFAVSASLYAMTTQANVIIANLAGGDAGWDYTSFLGHRNQFGGFSVVSIISALYLWQESGKNFYLAAVAVFFFNIVMTDSRNAFFSAVLLLGLYFVLRKKISIKALILTAIPVLVIVAVLGLRFSDMQGLFAHKGGRFEGGTLENESRFFMWQLLLEKLYEHGAFLSGFGIKSTHYFLPHSGIVHTSSHNAFMDLLFTGGIVKVSIYIMTLVTIYKNTCRHSNQHYRDLMRAALFTLIFYNQFDNGSILFTANSITSILYTIILAILTQHRE